MTLWGFGHVVPGDVRRGCAFIAAMEKCRSLRHRKQHRVEKCRFISEVYLTTCFTWVKLQCSEFVRLLGHVRDISASESQNLRGHIMCVNANFGSLPGCHKSQHSAR